MDDIQSKVTSSSSWVQQTYIYPCETWLITCLKSFVEHRDDNLSALSNPLDGSDKSSMDRTINVRTMSVEDALGLDPPPVAPVLMFCGHANVNGYSENTVDELAALAIKCKAIVVFFVGCCVGQVRYGPLLRITHTKGWTAIVGASDRMLTKENIINTLFLQGAAYFCKLLRHYNKVKQDQQCTYDIFGKRGLARFAFCIAYQVHPNPDTSDPFVFFNDSDEASTMISWHQLAYKDCLKHTKDDLLRIAQYHTWHCGANKQLVDSVQAQLLKFADKKSKNQIPLEHFIEVLMLRNQFDKLKEYLMLDTIDTLHQNLQKIEVTNDTLQKLVDGMWMKMAQDNPVQLAVALYRGVRGNLTENKVKTLIICCFKYAKTTEDKKVIATALVATCETAYVTNDQNNLFGVILMSMHIEIYLALTGEVYCKTTGDTINLDELIQNNGPFEDKFSLEELFVFAHKHSECVRRDDFVMLRNTMGEGSITLGSMDSIITAQKIAVGGTRTSQYTKEDFDAALVELSLFMKGDSLASKDGGYEVKEYSVTPPPGTDRIQVLPSWSNTTGTPLLGRELRLVPGSSEKAEVLQRCRFVYLYQEKKNNNGYRGYLYYTDVHYWWDLSILLDGSSEEYSNIQVLVNKASVQSRNYWPTIF